jgi:DNA polymerase I-like protein with 3'-5' exonuclease and polymerase domains
VDCRVFVRHSAALVRERMENVVQLTVPLTVDAGIGENWKEAKA